MSAPTSLLGHMDDNSLDISTYGSTVDYLLENIPQLTHPWSIRTYARMRHDPQIASILQAYGGPIGRASWSLDPAGCRDEVVARLADDLGLPVKGYTEGEPDDANPDVKTIPPTGARRRKFTFAEHLRVTGLYRVYGHMFFEQAWLPAAGGFTLDVVQERMPQTVEALHLNPDGTLQSIEQSSLNGPAPRITTADHRLVYYTRQREGSNYFGESMLRPMYGPWLIKDQMLRVHATSCRRFGMGVPTAQALPGTNPTPQEIAEAQRAVANARASEHSGIAMPPKFRYALEGMTGSVPDTLAFTVYLDRQMTRSALTSILDMATSEKGARSLGETVMDLMVIAQQADANYIADTATQQLVIPLVDANWGDGEPAPQICVGDVGADVELTAQDMNWLLEYGGLQPDQPARAWIRQRYGLPEEDPDFQSSAAAPSSAADPNAPDPNADHPNKDGNTNP